MNNQNQSKFNFLRKYLIFNKASKGISTLIAILIVVVLAVVVGGIVIWQQKELEKATTIPEIKLEEKTIKEESKEIIEDKSKEITQEEVANWKTYKNEKYGFEFKYSPIWKIAEERNNEKEFFLKLSPINKENIEFNISITHLSAEQNLEDYIKLYTGLQEIDPSFLVKSQKATLSGLPAYKIIITSQKDPTSYEMAVQAIKKIVFYNLSYIAKDKTYSNYIDDVDKMIKEFKIISLPRHFKSALDYKKISDLGKIRFLQEHYFGTYGRYYTCSVTGGDCGGQVNNYPLKIGDQTTPMNQIEQGEYIYKGLDNTKDSQRFCYYTKLDLGRYYTASHKGNFERDSIPTTLSECAISDIK